MRTMAWTCAVVMTMAAGAWQSVRADEGRAGRLTGSWHATVTLKDCTTGAPRPSFHSRLTFGNDGTLVETTNNAAFQPGQRSPGHGIWRALSARTCSAYSDAFIMFTSAPSAAPPSPGFIKGFQRISQTITFERHNEDAFTSVASVQFFDDAGTLLNQGCATAVGSRFTE